MNEQYLEVVKDNKAAIFMRRGGSCFKHRLPLAIDFI